MLQLNQIYKVFNEGTPDEKLALQNLQLQLKKGEFVTVIGSNGAGKSTLMNMVSGKILPDSGEVLIDGKNVSAIEEHSRAKDDWSCLSRSDGRNSPSYDH